MPDTASSAGAYLDAALDLMQRHALSSAALDWPAIRAEARSRAADATGPAGTYDAIRWALGALGDAHSFFSPPATATQAIAAGAYRDEVSAPTSRLVAPGVRLIEVPAFRGAPQDVVDYAVALHSIVNAHRASQGWIIDVSDNTGGNMIPMLAGLGPFFGDDELGAFRYPDGAAVPWSYRGGELWIGAEKAVVVPEPTSDVRASGGPVAVIQGPRTASSGEAVVIAFRGRPRTRTFGLATAGLTTCNDEFELSDGASMAITVAWFEDRRGGAPGGALQPDTVVAVGRAATEEAALEWVRRESAAR